MSGENEVNEPAAKKSGKLGLFIGLILMITAGAGGYFVTHSGVIGSNEATEQHIAEKELVAPEIAFVPMPPMIVSLGENASNQLRFQAQFEVDPMKKDDIAFLMPRIQDVLNGYLRAVDIEVLKRPASLVKLRSQMLRRVQLVAGQDSVRDLLITEFVFG